MSDRKRFACLECPFEADTVTAIRSHCISEHADIRQYYTDTGAEGNPGLRTDSDQ